MSATRTIMPKITPEIPLKSNFMNENMDKSFDPIGKSITSEYEEYNLRIKNFIRAIAKDDVVEMMDILNSVEPDVKVRLMNGRFKSYEKDELKPCVWNCEYIVDQLSVQYPISIAVVYMAKNCFEKLLNEGVNIYVSDHRGNNLVHLLIYINVIKPSDAVVLMYDILLAKLKTAEERKKMLLQYSDDGLCPLQLAAKLLRTDMFSKILYTEGVYRQVVSQQGKIIRNKFSFSFAANEHLCSSFLWQLTWIDDSLESSQAINTILKIPIMNKLINQYFMKCLPLLCFWAFMRALVGIVFFFADVTTNVKFRDYSCINDVPKQNITKLFGIHYFEENMTKIEQIPFEIAISFILFASYGIVTIFSDIAEFLFIWKHSHLISGQFWMKLMKSRLINTNFYRVCMLLLAFSNIVMNVTVVVSVQQPELAVTIANSLFILNRCLIVFGIMYFVQLLPLIGYFAIGFQKMLATMAKFAILQMIVIYLFSTLFMHVNVYYCTGSAYSCQKDGGFYSTFLYMLNIGSVIPENGQCNEWGITLFHIIHICYVFVVAITTVNYFIAVINSVYNVFNYHENSAVMLHRLHIVLVIERRMKLLKSILPNFLSKFMTCSDFDLEVREIDEDFTTMQNLRLEGVLFGEYCNLDGCGEDTSSTAQLIRGDSLDLEKEENR